MGIHYQLCFLASLLLVIHSGAISLPSDKDEAIAEDYLRDFSNLRDPASFLPEEKIDPLSERENKMEKLPVSGMLDKEYLNRKWMVGQASDWVGQAHPGPPMEPGLVVSQICLSESARH
ncbi:hypothetical protein G5714_002685 [Onychostoma macrolepis]|uniref:Uncharacterized protein n=1 Tax=Onychostoma macrolepis TaxID=369639 RepID=A0A7J6D7E9_9TELE|nr:hypothetical protein G5714_002685 [Onychostoma macrolepis]